MKRRRWNKKRYKGWSLEKLFMGILSVMLVLETNLISHTMQIPDVVLTLLGVFVVLLLDASVVARGRKINSEFLCEKRIIISDNAFKALKMVTNYGWLPVVPLIFMLFSDENNQRLFWLLISVMLWLLVKYIFDEVITFTDQGYSSGFDEIALDAGCRIEVQKSESVSWTGKADDRQRNDIEIYRGNALLGWDKFLQEDALYLVQWLDAKNKEW